MCPDRDRLPQRYWNRETGIAHTAAFRIVVCIDRSCPLYLLSLIYTTIIGDSFNFILNYITLLYMSKVGCTMFLRRFVEIAKISSFELSLFSIICPLDFAAGLEIKSREAAKVDSFTYRHYVWLTIEWKRCIISM